MRPWVEHASSPGYATPRAAGAAGAGIDSQCPPPPRPENPTLPTHTPGRDRSAEAAQVGESSASRSCAPPPLPPHWPFAGANGGKRGEALRSEIYQRGSSRGCHVRGGHDGPESRLRPRESVGVLALAEFPRTGRRSHPQASARGSREPPVFRRALGVPWPPAGGSQDSMFGASFPPYFPRAPGFLQDSLSSKLG